ncbi:MAG: hypothetical protein QOH61_361 [Chloroflexota bacterium]|nr:hypothetical protein [Chloroflexota bacterium]
MVELIVVSVILAGLAVFGALASVVGADSRERIEDTHTSRAAGGNL